jgi:hypothetical protein
VKPKPKPPQDADLQAVLRELARVKVRFQLRAILLSMGYRP